MRAESVLDKSETEKSQNQAIDFDVLTENSNRNASDCKPAQLASLDLPVLNLDSAKPEFSSTFQKSERDKDYEKFLQGFDLNSDQFNFSYKTSGSTIGLKVTMGKDAVAKWSPTNGTQDHEAQEVSHRLAQYLHVSDRVTPSSYYELTGPALDRFTSILTRSEEKDSRRQDNRLEVMSSLLKNLDGLTGVLTPWVPTITEVRGLNKDNGTVYGAFNENHPIASLIRADGPMPGDTPLALDTARGKLAAPENQLAKELSQIMVIDILTGQYDRFNGSNMEATYDPASGLHFFARDNGGASMDGPGKNTKEYLDIVSRFDKQQIQKVEALLKDLDGPKGAELVKELHLLSDPKHLKERAAALLKHVNKMRSTHGDDKVFFQN